MGRLDGFGEHLETEMPHAQAGDSSSWNGGTESVSGHEAHMSGSDRVSGPARFVDEDNCTAFFLGFF